LLSLRLTILNFLKTISNNNHSDEELVTIYQQHGDLKVLSALYQRYMDLVFGVCLKYLKDPEQSKDAVMQIFEELIIKVRNHEVNNFRGWLHVLAKNHCLMQLRSPKNLKTTEWNPDIMQSEENPHLNGVLTREENLDRLEDCIQHLPAEQKQAVSLFYLQEKCYNDIVSSTGMEWNTVRSLIQNGRRNLKICMEKKMKKENNV
jgi:RNA polymerase sigma-70 factor (ECF subfamily)